MVPVRHTCTVVHTGSFASARCTCGWRGSARRSIGRARADGAAHEETAAAAAAASALPAQRTRDDAPADLAAR
ncbi:hypothetical protein CLV35_0441 [Motilibacter peucedani]|uniref:Uncharacterized protein n=1 Tax=Motilibacter peucedani TaxID=598650 RepID=A0A420XT72_9ACTN|nr:hypothetical protein [Motilibacter peucedani]RKS80023.1 hypothetical protein CLV35_0441 [Motilibacter peucedani]